MQMLQYNVTMSIDVCRLLISFTQLRYLTAFLIDLVTTTTGTCMYRSNRKIWRIQKNGEEQKGLIFEKFAFKSENYECAVQKYRKSRKTVRSI